METIHLDVLRRSAHPFLVCWTQFDFMSSNHAFHFLSVFSRVFDVLKPILYNYSNMSQ